MKNLIKNLKAKVSSFCKEEDAQGLTEYILLAVIVVAIAALFKDKIMGIIRGKLGDLEKGVGGITSEPG